MRKFAALFALFAALCVGAPALAQSTASLSNGSRASFVAPVECSTSGAACTTGTSLAASSGVVGGLTIKAAPGLLYGINVVSGAAAGFVLVIDSTFVQGDGAVGPLLCMPMAANSGLSMQFGAPVNFTAGITIHYSTTGCYTKTASATAFISASYK